MKHRAIGVLYGMGFFVALLVTVLTGRVLPRDGGVPGSGWLYLPLGLYAVALLASLLLQWLGPRFLARAFALACVAAPLAIPVLAMLHSVAAVAVIVIVLVTVMAFVMRAADDAA